ncbi:MAG TPA: phosphoribosylamine--glycine ligase [Verrucomicrobiae bacterium]|nr:phosphoribosylamine--glycine ligase [Verrucomicrobiae bacterium]
MLYGIPYIAGAILMRILVIGGGGREHALVWKLAQSKHVKKLFCTPGNAGIAAWAECQPIAAADIERLAALALKEKVDLTIVGPEVPLCAGIVDAFQAKGLRAFGPTKRAAQLEGSKVFTKRLLLKYGVPTAPAEIFDKPEEARAYVRKTGAPVVVKADGLAAGKGVTVASTVEEAERAIHEMMEQRVFGTAGAQVIIEDCLHGEELSIMALVAGQSFQLLASAQDHKRAWDGDRGPNTGGMGAYSPTPLLDGQLEGQIVDIFRRTLAALRAEGIDYRGGLYAGLMMTDRGPQVLEFNCRFGDPETQVVLPRLESDLLEAIEATVDGSLDGLSLEWLSEAAVCVVLAAAGYPGTYERGRPIAGLKDATQLDKVYVFHAGTRRDATGKVVTDGGRVLGVTALGATMEQAARTAYEAVERIHFDGAQFRRDIAARALRKERTKIA